MVFRKTLHFLDRVSKAGMRRRGETYRKKQGSGELTVFSEWFPIHSESSIKGRVSNANLMVAFSAFQT